MKLTKTYKMFQVHMGLHTYICIYHYNPSVSIATWLPAPLMLRMLILYKQFKVVSERQIFGKLFTAILFTLRVFAICLVRGSAKEIFFDVSFCWRCLICGLNHGLKPTYYLLNQGVCLHVENLKNRRLSSKLHKNQQKGFVYNIIHPFQQ